jgi:hypothetical protein
MRKLLYTLSILLLTQFGYSQCTPDPSFTSPGYYTNAGKNKLSTAYLNQPYEDTITVIVPKDTLVVGNPISIDSVVLVSVRDLPPGLSYATPSNTFPGGGKTCVKVSGTPTKAGTSTIIFDVVIYVKGTGGLPKTETFDFEVLDTNNPSSVLIHEQKVVESAILAPNPATNKTQVIIDGKMNSEFTVSIHNLVGEQIYSERFDKNQNDEQIWISTENYPSGVYIYSISSSIGEKVGRLIIAD